MHIHTLIFAIMVAIFSPTSLLAADGLVLSDQAYGRVTFGSKLLEAEKKLGEKAKGDTGDPGCDYVKFNSLPGVIFMVEKGIVTRADALSPEIKNVLHVKVGAGLSEIQRRYPKVELKPHKYVEDGHYLVFKSKDGKRALLLEEVDGIVTKIRAGIEPSVEYVEGCL